MTRLEKIAKSTIKSKIPIFPVSADKIPLIKGWKEKATYNKDQIKKWLKLKPAFWGVPTGEPSGMFVLDVDFRKKNGKPCGLPQLGVLNLDDLKTYKQETQSTYKGKKTHHYLFRWQERMGDLKNGRLADSTVDVKTNGGYIILYRPFPDRSVIETMPDDIFKAVLISRKRENALSKLPENKWREGFRNNTLNTEIYNDAVATGGENTETLVGRAILKGMPVAEAKATMLSAFEAGLRKRKENEKMRKRRKLRCERAGSNFNGGTGDVRKRLKLALIAISKQFNPIKENGRAYKMQTISGKRHLLSKDLNAGAYLGLDLERAGVMAIRFDWEVVREDESILRGIERLKRRYPVCFFTGPRGYKYIMYQAPKTTSFRKHIPITGIKFFGRGQWIPIHDYPEVKKVRSFKGFISGLPTEGKIPNAFYHQKVDVSLEAFTDKNILREDIVQYFGYAPKGLSSTYSGEVRLYENAPTGLASFERRANALGHSFRFDMLGEKIFHKPPGEARWRELKKYEEPGIVADIEDKTACVVYPKGGKEEARVVLPPIAMDKFNKYVDALALKNRVNRFSLWIESIRDDKGLTMKNAEGGIRGILRGCFSFKGDKELSLWVLTAFLVQCVRRQRLDKVKFDIVPVLVGGPAIGKTLFLSNLLPYSDLYTDCLNVNDKIEDWETQIRDKVIGCIPEIGSFGKQAHANLRIRSSSTHLKSRRKYGRDGENSPRRASYCSDSNDSKFIHVEDTPCRRVVPIPVGRTNLSVVSGESNPGRIMKKLTEGARDELWRCADYLDRNGFNLIVTDKTEKAISLITRSHSQRNEEMEEFLNYRFSLKNKKNCVLNFPEICRVVGEEGDNNMRRLGQWKLETAIRQWLVRKGYEKREVRVGPNETKKLWILKGTEREERRKYAKRFSLDKLLKEKRVKPPFRR